MLFLTRWKALIATLVLAAGFAMVAVDFAEARRGGGFGSRGARTFDAPAATRTAPRQAQPIDRSMTPRQATQQPGAAGQPAGAQRQAAGAQRPGMFGGMMGGILGGLMLGGLIGLLLGNGLGGLAGFFGLLLQVALIGLVVWFVMRLFARRQPQPAGATAGGTGSPGNFRFDGSAGGGSQGAAGSEGRSGIPAMGAAPLSAPRGAPAANAMSPGDEVGITGKDLDTFERILKDIQDAFTREDYAALRERSTPEIVSFLSEELSSNATRGVRNTVSDIKLLQGDLAEAWQDGSEEYATVAMRYESIDVMRDRQTGEIVEGSPEPTETTEVWTFVRTIGGDWKLSAIQDA